VKKKPLVISATIMQASTVQIWVYKNALASREAGASRGAGCDLKLAQNDVSVTAVQVSDDLIQQPALVQIQLRQLLWCQPCHLEVNQSLSTVLHLIILHI
jgi:hypothetical protein